MSVVSLSTLVIIYLVKTTDHFVLVVEDAIFVAAFNDEDPGVTQIAQRCEFISPFSP